MALKRQMACRGPWRPWVRFFMRDTGRCLIAKGYGASQILLTRVRCGNNYRTHIGRNALFGLGGSEGNNAARLS
jgi:hypothetical protein